MTDQDMDQMTEDENEMERLSRKLSNLGEIRQELKVVTLKKSEACQSLGFTIVGGEGKEYGSGIYIKNVIPGGLAEQSGKMKRGDKIMWVGDENLERVSHKEAAWILQNTGEQVELVLSRMLEKKSILDETCLSPLGSAQLIENKLTNEEPNLFEVRYLVEWQS